MTIRKRVFSAMLCALLVAAMLPAKARAAAPSGHSGELGRAKLSQEQIVQLLTENPNYLPGNPWPTAEELYDELPSTQAPYAAGALKPAVLQATLNRLNALRALAGLSPVALDAERCLSAQHAAVLCAASEFSHTPSKPADMPDDFYQKGYQGTSSCNLAWGYSLLRAPDGWMDDSDNYNIDRVGHRRWQLNPHMGKVGFGHAGSMTAESVFDSSVQPADYDFVAWPASGNFPSELFGASSVWSISLNPSKYATPRKEDITVTVTEEQTGTAWTLSGTRLYDLTSSKAYLNVDTGGYGISNCIIFRPDMAGTPFGVYTVTITGLRDSSGNRVPFSYRTSFFSLQGGWIRDEAGWRYMTDGRLARDRWQRIDGKWYYFGKSGYMQTGWQQLGGKWYYLASGGAMQTGWLKSGSRWYYLASDGVMQTGWKKLGGKWYYFSSGGVMQTGWQQIGDKWYYLASGGAMQTGWLKSGSRWYYLASDGVMQTGWEKIGGKWYYFSSGGVMVSDTSLVIKGKTYHFDASGICTNP